MTETLVFSDETQCVPVKIGDKDYTLKEASGGAVNVWNNKIMEGTTIGPDGTARKITGLGDLDTLLLSYCFFDSGMKLVGLHKIKQWPDRIQKGLIKQLKEISDIKEQVSTEQEMLLKALKRDDSPVSLDAFRTWVNNLVKEDEDFEVLVNMIKPDIKEIVKKG